MSGVINWVLDDEDDPFHADWTGDVDHGTDGSDTMFGGDYWGVELHGGAGDDLYYIFFGESGNTIVDTAGHDTIEIHLDAGETYVMPEGIEDLSVEAIADGGWGPWADWDWTDGVKDADYDTTEGVTITGNGLDNRISGSDMADLLSGGNGKDELSGSAGADTLTGGNGDDHLRGESGDDLLQGGADDDALFGGDGADNLQGGSGNDSFEGGAGADTMVGGTGDDLFYLDSSADVIKENTGDVGIDTVVVRWTNSYDLANAPAIENLDFDTYGSNPVFGQYSGFGNEGGNQIYGHWEASNYVEARGGADLVHGGQKSDTILGGEGSDTVKGLGGTDVLRGEGGHDSLLGDWATDWLDGGTGNDRLDGGSSDDILLGGQGADSLLGGTGNDNLSGGTEADRLEGGAGRDTVLGGAGADWLWGGGEQDLFRFTAASDSTTANRDVIWDFQTATYRSGTPGGNFIANDRLDLSAIDADTTLAGNQAFHWTGTGAFFKSAGDLWISAYSQGTYLRGDTNGDAVVDFEVYLVGVTNLGVADIVL